MLDLDTKKTVQKWINGSFNDPVVKIILKKSNLTKIQLETLLIDILGPNISQKDLTMEKKARLRLFKAGVSRGSFNRTLRQARQNVIKSIFTILLLGYLGVFEDARLTPYLEVANKLQSFLEAYEGTTNNEARMDKSVRIVEMVHKQLKESLERMSRPREL